jgi:opacity protein-like surface antigen
LNRYFAVEARYASGVKSDDANFSGFNVDLSLDYLYGAYAKGILPLGRASPFVLVGYTHGKETEKVKAIGLSASASAGGFSYGFGVDVPITKAVSLDAEWARLIKGTDAAGVGFKIEALSVGVAMRF